MNATRMTSGSDDPWKWRLAIAVVGFCILIAVSISIGILWWTGPIMTVCAYGQGWNAREITLPRDCRSWARQTRREGRNV
jgi:hypothetical protein